MLLRSATVDNTRNDHHSYRKSKSNEAILRLVHTSVLSAHHLDDKVGAIAKDRDDGRGGNYLAQLNQTKPLVLEEIRRLCEDLSKRRGVVDVDSEIRAIQAQ